MSFSCRQFMRACFLPFACALCLPYAAAGAENVSQSMQTPPPATPVSSSPVVTTPQMSSIPMEPATSRERMRILLVANQEATIASRLYGTIKEIQVRESESFKKGQALVTFDCRELAAERGVAQAELKLHNTTNQANTELYKEQVIGDLEKKLSQVKVEEAGAKIKAVSAKMENCSIMAPFDGQVVELLAKAHETLQPGAPIMLIQNSRDLDAHVHVPSKWMEWLKPGSTFTAFIEETGKSYEAKVTAVGARVDPVSRTVKIYAKLPGDHPELLPGMSGYAEFKQP